MSATVLIYRGRQALKESAPAVRGGCRCVDADGTHSVLTFQENRYGHSRVVSDYVSTVVPDPRSYF